LGRLFWKVLAFTLLAQLIATIGVGGAIWLRHASYDVQSERIDRSPPAAFMIEAAASTLQHGGVSALQHLLGNGDLGRPVLAVGDDNQELLGRALDPQVLAAARFSQQSNGMHPVVRQVQAPDGRRYLLFMPAVSAPSALPQGAGVPPVAPGQSAPPEPPVQPGQQGQPGQPGQTGQRGSFGAPPPMDMHDLRDHGEGFHPGQGPQMRDGGRPPDGQFSPLLPIVSAILCSLIIAFLVAWYFSKPIRSLRAAFNAVAGGDLTVRLGGVNSSRRDELSDLGRDFDAMVERLRALMNGQRRLLHDASHELRSPLARLQVAIGLARQKPDKLDASLERIERESTRMEKLVGELLTLSKLEAGALKPDHDDVDIDELMAELVFDARFEAEASDRKLEFSGDCGVVLKGDEELLHRALENVLRNALKQTVVGSTVVLEAGLGPRNRELRIAIMDRGPGVPKDELDLIFEPFFRGAESAKSTDGHGLGLAIARHVVAAHGGRIRASNREGGGLMVEILLPLDSEKATQGERNARS